MIRRLAQSMVGYPLRSYVPVLPCVHWFRMSQGPSGYRIGWMDWLHRDHGLSHPSQQKMLNKAASQCGSYFIIFPHSFPFRKRMFAGYSFNYPSSPKKLRHSYGDQPAPTTFHYTPWQSNLASFRCLKTFMFQWIGLRENLQETIVFTIKYRAFL